MDYQSLLNNKFFYIFVGVAIIYSIFTLIYMSKSRGKAKKWLADNPTAAKVYIVSKSNLIKSTSLQVHNVDDEAPILFNDSVTKAGFAVLEGTHVIECTYASSRPGVLHKRVTTTYGPVKLEIEVEANRHYELYFNKKEENFVFEEVSQA